MILKFKPFVICLLLVFGVLSVIDQALGSTAPARKVTHLAGRKIQQHILDLEDMAPKVLKNCYYPKASRAAEVLEELSNQSPKAARISLQGKNLLFSSPSTKAMFDPTVVHEFALALPKTLRVLDLSLNRFPAELLPSIYPLLQRPNFRFLDVRTNAGADSLEAMEQLANLHAKSRNLPAILRKVIWVQESYFEEASFLPQTYKKAHRSYYLNEYESPEPSQWKLPE